MFKYDDRFSIDSDKYQWLLHDYTRGKNRKGEPSINDRVTYHSTFSQLAIAIIDRSAKDCLDLLELVDMLMTLENKLDKYLENEVK